MVFEYRSLDFLSREGGSFLMLRDSYKNRSINYKTIPKWVKIKSIFKVQILKIFNFASNPLGSIPRLSR